jgi:tetratricopeptide (TPR) repeat protein
MAPLKIIDRKTVFRQRKSNHLNGLQRNQIIAHQLPLQQLIIACVLGKTHILYIFQVYMPVEKTIFRAVISVLGWMLLTAVYTPLSGQNLDSLKNVLLKEKSSEKRIQLLKTLGEAQLTENPREAISYFEEILTIAQEQDNKLLTSYALNRIGSCWYYQNDFKQSTQFYFQALESTEEKPEYFDLKSKIYNNLGWSFKKFEDFEKALEYLRMAENYARKSDTRDVLGMILNNKGVTHKDLKQYEQALASLNESLAINQKTGNKRQERFNLNNIAVVYLEMNHTSKAIEKLEQLLVLNEYLRDTSELINNLQNLGSAYTRIAAYPQAEHSFLQALEYAEKRRNAEMKQNVLSEISAMYRKQGKHAEAFDRFKEFYALSDSLKTQETKRYALELESQYNNLIKERELETARKELAEQRLYLTWFVGALLLAVFVVIFFWRAILLKRRNEQNLITLNHEIKEQSGQLLKGK